MTEKRILSDLLTRGNGMEYRVKQGWNPLPEDTNQLKT